MASISFLFMPMDDLEVFKDVLDRYLLYGDSVPISEEEHAALKRYFLQKIKEEMVKEGLINER